MSSFKFLLIFNYDCLKLTCHRLTFNSKERNKPRCWEIIGIPFLCKLPQWERNVKEQTYFSFLERRYWPLKMSNSIFIRDLNKTGSLYYSFKFQTALDQFPCLCLGLVYDILIDRISYKQHFYFYFFNLCLRKPSSST